jgi:PTH1 family peptidyl-tRNA hydrolase
VVLARPQTYMNLSGQAVKSLAQWLRIGASEILVVYDDLDLPVGRIRLRPGGSAGGHRGMESIIACLGSQEFPRLRVGIGRPAGAGGRENEAIDHVLGPFSAGERQTMSQAYDRAAEALECILSEGLEAAMNRFNAEAPVKAAKPAAQPTGPPAGPAGPGEGGPPAPPSPNASSKERPNDVVP